MTIIQTVIIINDDNHVDAAREHFIMKQDFNYKYGEPRNVSFA
jgi:hypothetical protein